MRGAAYPEVYTPPARGSPELARERFRSRWRRCAPTSKSVAQLRPDFVEVFAVLRCCRPAAPQLRCCRPPAPQCRKSVEVLQACSTSAMLRCCRPATPQLRCCRPAAPQQTVHMHADFTTDFAHEFRLCRRLRQRLQSWPETSIPATGFAGDFGPPGLQVEPPGIELPPAQSQG